MSEMIRSTAQSIVERDYETALPALVKALPRPRVEFEIRDGTLADIPFIDRLQKKHGKQVGWMPTKQLEGKIAAGHVLIAEADEPIGYVIGNDRYFKRDDCGIIYQMNVVPGTQRKLVGATLLQALFERSAYGCKLFCCWCAQDIEANRFWEACGFVPLAFRAGSEKKARIHIFWQKRIRAGDTTTPWWYPTETSGGSIRENRIVLPIPPGTHWSDAKPLVLPGREQPATAALPVETKARRATKARDVPEVAFSVTNGFRFDVPQAVAAPNRKTPEPKPKARNDPMLIAKARELRDRWLEQVNANAIALPSAKYDVAKRIAA